ncbi:SAM-dependent methyltransferase [Selenomonas dianae]|uniref:Tetrapyrrole methylase domain-containing protein n=1 Tax=Selenomonas dianae TaxID=135079 RepID=A0ABN0SXE6_9FIRM|nr:SAM-dependent methyltransferase [Selenomonas dianae]WLD83039.1 SAM-dependent methyltransferase [Selenomonas dianae]
MADYKLTVAGLGPGDAGFITRETWARIEAAEHILLRTRIHPTVEALDAAEISYETYDAFYEEADDFDLLYERIVDDLLTRVRESDVLYLVPGSPFVAERTVQLLRERAIEAGMPLEILPAMSFLEIIFAAVGLDPVHGLSIVDAMDEEAVAAPPAQDLIITQLYSRELASELKILLMEQFPDTQEVIYLHHLALPDQSVRRIPLFELDWQDDIDHLTSLFIPYTPSYWEST